MLGCTPSEEGGLKPEDESIEYVYEGRPPATPPGVVRYCWEEPLVDYEIVNPGITEDGVYWEPYHSEIHKVRSGRWRPCERVTNEPQQGSVK